MLEDRIKRGRADTSWPMSMSLVGMNEDCESGWHVDVQ